MEDRLTAPDGPVAYYATLAIRAMVLAMRAAGVPADISDTAGTWSVDETGCVVDRLTATEPARCMLREAEGSPSAGPTAGIVANRQCQFWCQSASQPEPHEV